MRMCVCVPAVAELVSCYCLWYFSPFGLTVNCINKTKSTRIQETGCNKSNFNKQLMTTMCLLIPPVAVSAVVVVVAMATLPGASYFGMQHKCSNIITNPIPVPIPINIQPSSSSLSSSRLVAGKS